MTALKFPRISRPGFTILELLIVVVLVGILAAAAVYYLNLTRASNRDAKRVSDVSVIRAGLTQYWLQKANYPTSDPVDLGRPQAGADHLTMDGFVAADRPVNTMIIEKIPTGPKPQEYYQYHGSAKGYSLRFVTERPTIYGPPGTWYAHADGVDQEDMER